MTVTIILIICALLCVASGIYSLSELVRYLIIIRAEDNS